jgi:hypothetical protein
MPRIFWIGAIGLIVGTGPLLAIITAAELGLTRDPNPNPIGPGLLAFLTFWPSIILLVIGVGQKVREPRTGRLPPDQQR